MGLSSNQLTGTISSEIRNLTLLHDLKLYNNYLHGIFPFELHDLIIIARHDSIGNRASLTAHFLKTVKQSIYWDDTF